MRIRFQKFAALLLAALLAGCSASAPAGTTPAGTDPSGAAPAGTTDTPTAMGRWVEQQIDLSDQPGQPFLGPVLLDDGSLLLFNAEQDSIYAGTYALSSADNGLTWSQTDLGLDDVADGAVIPQAVAPDGTVFFFLAGEERQYYLHRPGQVSQPVDLSSIENYAGGCYSCTFYDADTLLLFPETWHTLEDMGGNQGLAVTSDEETGAFGSVDGQAWLLDVGSGALRQLDYDTAAWPTLPTASIVPCVNGFRFCGYDGRLGEISLEGGVTELLTVNESAELAMDSEGACYLAGTDGISRLAPGGTLPEVMIEGLGTVLSLENSYLEGFCRAADGSFLVMARDAMNSMDAHTGLYRYSYDADQPLHAVNSLEVWSLYENATVRLAVTNYLQQQHDVDITLTVGVPGLEAVPPAGRTDDEIAAINDALTTLNTALLAGAGPDVLILDGANYENYSRRGLLADLSSAVAMEELMPNIVAPFTGADDICVLPARFSVPVIIADADDTADLADLDTLLAAIEAGAPRPSDGDSDFDPDYYTPLDPKYALDFASARSMAEYLLDTSAAALLHDGALDETALRQLLTFAQAVGQHYGMDAYTGETVNGSASSWGDSDAVTVWARSEKYLICDRARWGWEIMQTPGLVTWNRYDKEKSEKVPNTLVAAPGLCAGAYLPTTLAAVNAGSANREAALGFITMLFSPTVQDVYCGDGMPVRQTSLEASIARNIAEANVYKGDMMALLDSLQTAVVPPQALQTTFGAHLAALLAGRESLDEAVAGIRSDLALYLAEQE